MSAGNITRRAVIAAAFGGAGALIWNANSLTLSPGFAHVFGAVEDWTRLTQRTLLLPGQLAREYSLADISPTFKPNGTFDPGGDDYNAHVAQNFANWRLRIDGAVVSPLSLSVSELRALPSRTQITRHDCVEGWSAIGMWTGVQLGLLLKAAGLSPSARYAVFHCADNLDGEPSKGGEQNPGQYYESIDLVDAFHPQTLVAYALNGKPLDVAHGAPSASGWSGSSDTSTRSTSSGSRSPTASPTLLEAAAAIGRTEATNGTRAFEARATLRRQPGSVRAFASAPMFSLVGNAQSRALRLIRRSAMLNHAKAVACALIVGATVSSFAVAQSSSSGSMSSGHDTDAMSGGSNASGSMASDANAHKDKGSSTHATSSGSMSNGSMSHGSMSNGQSSQ